MKHKCDGCKYKGEHQEMMFRPFGVCTRERDLVKAEQAYNADTCPYAKPDTDQLKPCPFCGSKALIFYTMELGIPTGYEGARVTIRCTNTSECGAQISKWAAKKAWSKASVIKAWNRSGT